MTSYYLRVEAVNLSGFLDDTGQLSVVRGGGLLLLGSTERIEREFRSLTAISTGASQGLFEFTAQDEPSAARQRDDVQRFLSTDAELCHATFVVDVTRADGFGQARQELLALNRWRQWRQPTVAVPSQPAQDRDVCDFDGLRPATRTLARDDKPKPASESVFLRWNHGRAARQGFYQSETSIAGLTFTDDLETLARDPARGNLDGKLAVIYADGNSFGKIPRPTADEARDFDAYLERQRRAWLTSLLERARAERSGFHTHDGELRLETLLWGGDEFLIVVPAWKGWDTLVSFFQHARSWEFGGCKLTHAAGLVFCHAQAPIRRVRVLAHDLAERAKVQSREKNLFAYQVLESFDHVGRDLDAFLESRWQRTAELVVRGEAMHAIAEQARRLAQGEFPRSKLHAIARALVPHGGEHEASRPRAEAWIATALEKRAHLNAPVAELRALFAGAHDSAVTWFHLAELWDYLEGAC